MILEYLLYLKGDKTRTESLLEAVTQNRTGNQHISSCKTGIFTRDFTRDLQEDPK